MITSNNKESLPFLRLRKALLGCAAAALLAATPASAQESWPEVAPSEPPADWGAVSANFEEIPTPTRCSFSR